MVNSKLRLVVVGLVFKEISLKVITLVLVLIIKEGLEVVDLQVTLEQECVCVCVVGVGEGERERERALIIFMLRVSF